MAEDERTGVYPIGVVRSLTGLSERQIRYYERYGLVRPARTPGGKRLYSTRDVARLREIKAQMEAGSRLADIRRRLGPAPATRERLRREDLTIEEWRQGDIRARFKKI